MLETRTPAAVHVTREGVEVNGVQVPGVGRVEFQPGKGGQRPRVVLTVEADIVTATQCPENKHLFVQEFDRMTMNRYNTYIERTEGQKQAAAL